jgi:hypothetical protein
MLDRSEKQRDREAFRHRARSQVFAITRAISQGPFASLKRAPDLLADGVTHVLNCVAGQNRSPTIIWLYLVACGPEPAVAKELIERRTLDACPGHSLLVDDALVRVVREHGRLAYQPHPRPEAIEAAACLT